MEQKKVYEWLEQVRDGALSPDEALLKLRGAPYEDLGFAKVDHHRMLRQGASEIIYGAGKTVEQIRLIALNLLTAGQEPVLITRIDKETAAALSDLPLRYNEAGRIAVLGANRPCDGDGEVLIACAGTSDLPVAEEAAETASALGNSVSRLYDVGVSGLHRLLNHIDMLMTANVVVVIAGMEGALPSVIAGLVDCPVIATPTSVGYGTAFGGVTALLAMLNSCASGVSVVNIDNGFGAAYQASMINHCGKRGHR